MRATVLTAFISAFLAVSACATNPVTKKQEFVLMSEARELDLGRQMDPEIKKQYGVYQSTALQEYVAAIGGRIASVSDRPELSFHFTVLDSPIVNAFALPGGYVYVTRGLLAYMGSEAELAGVLAHEVGHVTARHAVRQYTKSATYQIGAGIASVFFPQMSEFGQVADIVFTAISSGYSRQFETEADRVAVVYATAAGYDPRGMASMLKTLNLLDRAHGGQKTYTSLFATHPRTGKRIEDVERELLAGMDTGANLTMGTGSYLRAIDGLLFGDDPHQGIIVGNRFQHPDLRLELSFPQGWVIRNSPEAVVAQTGEPDAQLVFRIQQLAGVHNVRDAALDIAASLKLTMMEGSVQRINALDAYVGTFGGTAPNLLNVRVRMGCFKVGDMIYYVAGVARVEDYDVVLPSFEKTIRSVRRLSRQEAGAIRPQVIRLQTVQKKTTLKEVLNSLGRPASEYETVALLNAFDPESPPPLQPGTLIKVLQNNATGP